MRIRSWLVAIFACWIIPWVIFTVTEKIYLTRLDESTNEASLPVQEETIPDASNAIHLICVKMDNNTMTEIELDEYLTGVVLGEMPADFEPEALKAQVVVARTYTLKRVLSQRKHEDCDVCTNAACCQAYCSAEQYLKAGNSQDKLKKVSAAVLETEDLVLYYGTELIDATYFSCAGDRTEEALAVWGTDVPYLRSVESPGEEISDNYSTSVSFSVDTFLHLLGKSELEPSQIHIGQITYTNGGGVDSIEICGTQYKGTQMRNLLGLRSTDFELTVTQDQVVITTKGYGHRVGMSQYGAQAMALQGSDFEEILQHYYPGTVLETWHNN